MFSPTHPRNLLLLLSVWKCQVWSVIPRRYAVHVLHFAYRRLLALHQGPSGGLDDKNILWFTQLHTNAHKRLLVPQNFISFHSHLDLRQDFTLAWRGNRVHPQNDPPIGSKHTRLFMKGEKGGERKLTLAEKRYFIKSDTHKWFRELLSCFTVHHK